MILILLYSPPQEPSRKRENMKKPPRSGRADAAFTLTELLVTIAIIAVLALLSFFGYSRYRGSADKTAAANNLRQLQIANADYASDHGGRYVSGFSRDENMKLEQWDRNLDFLSRLRGDSPLSKNGREDVPVTLLDPAAYRAHGKNYNMLRGSYGIPDVYGVSYGTPDSDSSLKLVQVTSPERTAAFMSAIDWRTTYGARLNWSGDENNVGKGMMAYRHNNKALVAYYDGHVGAVSKEDMKKIDSEGGMEHPFWKGNY